MIEAKELYSLLFYEYGEAYLGSADGMRFRLAREPLENVRYTPPEKRGEAHLLAQVWTGPLSYAKTPADEMTGRTFPFSEEGLAAAAAWLEEMRASLTGA